MTGDIMSISRLRMGTDGEGVTTLVAFFGCPLNCKYCINDFCHDKGEKFYLGEKPRAAFRAEELIEILAQDEIYYLMSNGGITFGGGEPLLQAAFIKEVCSLANNKWKMRIETSLYAPWENIALLIGCIDEWIVDIKEMNRVIYKKYTGKSNSRMLSNLKKMLSMVPVNNIRVRIPRISGFNNNDDIERSIRQLGKLGVVRFDEFEYIVT